MANLQSRHDNGKRLYTSSALFEMNQARRIAAKLRPVRASCAAGAELAKKSRISTLQDLIDNSPKVDALCGSGDSHLLVPDDMNPGYFVTKPLYDYSDVRLHGGQYICDVHEGRIALHGDTLILWK